VKINLDNNLKFITNAGMQLHVGMT